jgi:hypothetical protein
VVVIAGCPPLPRISETHPPLPPENEKAPSTLCYLLEIARRNQLRQEAGLPVLNVRQELRRLRTAEAHARFEEFVDARQPEMWKDTLAAARLQRGEAWTPSWQQGLRYQTRLRTDLWKRFEALTV